jgi:hypothetical protein
MVLIAFKEAMDKRAEQNQIFYVNVLVAMIKHFDGLI